MLIRISLIVAIIAGLAVGVLNFVTVKDKITTLQTDLSTTKDTLAKTQSKLSKTEKELASTRSQLEETNKILVATFTERDTAVQTAETAVKRATVLTEELTKTKQERDDAQANLAAYKATGFDPGQILTLGKTLKQTQDEVQAVKDENRLFVRRIKKLETELAIYKTPEFIVALPASLKGKILVSDPKWDFVVLDVGENQGVLEHGEFLVNRNGSLVAKVRVTSVQKDRSIANVLPGWKLGEVLEGDQVIPAHPASS
jgi:myosin heavy subunit